MTALLDYYGRPVGATKFSPAALANAGCLDATQAPQCVNLTIYEGDDFLLDMAVFNEAGDPIDLTAWGGAVPKAQIRPSTESEAIIAAFEWEIDVVNTNVIHWHLTSTVNQNMPHTPAVWDAQVTWYGFITTLAAGTVTWTQEVTRP